MQLLSKSSKNLLSYYNLFNNWFGDVFLVLEDIQYSNITARSETNTEKYDCANRSIGRIVIHKIIYIGKHTSPLSKNDHINKTLSVALAKYVSGFSVTVQAVAGSILGPRSVYWLTTAA